MLTYSAQIIHIVKKRRTVMLLVYLVIYSLFSEIILVALADEVESTNFIIRGDNLSAGAGTGDSTNFGMTGDVNPFSDLADSTNFRQELGYNPRIQAITPVAPLLSNTTGNYYDRLLLTVNPSGNPSDTLFAIAVSDDDFVTYQYVQNDNTLGPTLGIEDYQTYTAWGGASGFLVLGLNQNYDYKARVKALNGDFTETGYGPESAEASTVVPFVTLEVSDTEVHFGTLSASVVSETSSVTITVNTNGEGGYQTYLNGTGDTSNGGLYDGAANLILSQTTLLSAGTEGYGAQGSAGVATVDAKYDVSGDNVGSIDITNSSLSSNTAPVTDEDTDVLFKSAMSSTTTAGEYTDTVYFTVSPVL